MNWKTIKANWKTTLAGIIGFIAIVPGVVPALQAWGRGVPINWRQLGVNVAIAVLSGGLLVAKDSSNHSTLPEVEAATEKQLKNSIDSSVK